MDLATDPQEFNDQVNSDIRDQASPEIHDALRRPENLTRWILALTQLKRSTESQLASYAASIAEARVKYSTENDRIGWLNYKARQERWRSDAIRFKNGVENKLDEAKYLQGQALDKLINAIREHRDAVDNFEATDLQIGQEDEKLWSVLDD